MMMMSCSYNQNMNSRHASAYFAEAACSCANTACMNYDSSRNDSAITVILDAITMASIIICAILALATLLVLASLQARVQVLVLVLLVVLLAGLVVFGCQPQRRTHA